ncbi:hypothetical protein EU537_00035 [Candidatus Thorarchaeota archaeon]|nr:MAG: hypothetical protein EU537_00035 [Candidatus Thorarchaeota archaeon]
MYSFDEIAIFGYGGRNVPNEYLHLKKESDKLAMIFPGRGYTTQAPLLYYTARTLLDKGYNVLNINYNYLHNSDFSNASKEDQIKWIRTDTSAAYESTKKIDADVEIIVGKSLGTIALSHLLKNYPETRQMKTIWHTPLILSEDIQDAIRFHSSRPLLVIGKKDPHYEVSVLEDLLGSTDGVAKVIEDANHGMEVPGGPQALLEVMIEIVKAMTTYIESD